MMDLDGMFDEKRKLVQDLMDSLKSSRADEVQKMLMSRAPSKVDEPAMGMSEGGYAMAKGGMIPPDVNTDETSPGAPDGKALTVEDEHEPALNDEGQPSKDDEIEHGEGYEEDCDNEPAIAMLRKKVAKK